MKHAVGCGICHKAFSRLQVISGGSIGVYVRLSNYNVVFIAP